MDTSGSHTAAEKKVLVIIPAYNEAEGIGKIVSKIRATAPALDIVVVDDGSSDGTAEKARSAGAMVLQHPFNMGYGVALQTGYKYAWEQGYDNLVQLDGDGQHDPAYIPQLLDLLKSGRTDMVLGSRFLKALEPREKEASPYRTGVTRMLGIRLFAFLTTRLIGLKITDPTSGYQAMTRRVFAFFTRDIFPCDYPDADVIVMVHRAGFRVSEIPMVMYGRGGGKSMHSGIKPVYYVFKMFLSMFMTLIRKKPELG
jgi:glycosyltransferase involved in cell wall biosynthesis